MKLPGGELVHIEPTKVRDYLLSRQHPVGRFKAVFFEGLGYSAADWRQLEVGLRQIAADGEATVAERTRYGQKYVVRGTLRGPAGRVARVVTIWMIRPNDETPGFVTAFPGG